MVVDIEVASDGGLQFGGAAVGAVTQRFGDSSAALLEAVFALAVERMPKASHPQLWAKLAEFRAVLADDGTVVIRL